MRQYRPWATVAGDECAPFGFEARDFEARALRLLESCESRLIESELWTGAIAATAGFPNAYFEDGNATEVYPEAVAIPFANTLAEIEQAACDCTCGPIFVHAQRRVAEAWVAAGLLRREGNRLLTLLDNVVVPGCGYSGVRPDETAADGDASYIYATGPVQLLRSSPRVIPDSMDEALNRTTNLVQYRVERTVAAIWSGCCQLGLSVDLTTERGSVAGA